MLKWLGLTCIAVLFAAVLLVTRYDKLHDTSGQGYDAKCIQPNDPSATAISLICTIQHSQKTQGSKYEPAWWHVFLTWPEGITAWLLLLTLAAIVWQSYATSRAATATEQAVVAADKAYALAKETTKRQLRAYMCVSKAYAIIHEGQGVEFYVGFRNSGQTPAYKFEGIQRSGISVHPIPDAPVRALPSPKSSGMTGAGDVYHIRSWTNPAIRLSCDELIEAISGDQVLYMSGIYTYQDIFGDRHTLHIQQIAGGPTRVRRTNLKDKPGQMSITLYADEAGNYEEEEQQLQNPN